MLETHNHWILYCVFFFSLVVQTCFAENLDADNQFFGGNWPVSFKQNSKTLPSIEVRLDPPEDSHPQVKAEIFLLERARLRMEEAGMAKIEDEYNRLLDTAQKEIENAIDQAMRVFDDPRLLKAGVRHALLPITNKRKALKAIKGSFASSNVPSMPMFTQQDKKTNQAASQTNSYVKKHQNGPIDITSYPSISTSFLETKSTSNSKIIGGMAQPSVQITVDDVTAPSKKIKAKMDEIEQKRADEEAKMFEQAVEELNQLKRITIQELEKNIQLQMNPFLVDTGAVVNQVQQELPKRGMISKLLAFREIDGKKQKVDDTKAASFLEVAATTKANQLFSRKQLNVRLGQSDKPYPTIDELFSEAQKKKGCYRTIGKSKSFTIAIKIC